MKHQDFESQLRQQMDGYEVAPPEGLWDAVGQKVGSADRKRVSRPMIRRWMAAAAALLLLVGGAGWMYQQHILEKEKLTALAEKQSALTEKQSAQAGKPSRAPEPINILKDESITRGVYQPATPITRRHDTSTTLPDDLMADRHDNTKTDTNDEKKADAHDELMTDGHHNTKTDRHDDSHQHEETQADRHKSTRTDQHQGAPEPRQNIPMPRNYRTASSNNSEDARLMAYVHTDGIVSGDYVNHSPVRMSDAMKSTFESAYQYSNHLTRMEDEVNLTGYEEVTRYAQPVKFGVAVATSLQGRWGLQTGLNYMRQQTVMTHIMPIASIRDEQTYHYVGVPVQLTYRVVGASWGSIYGLAGAEADFNVKATGSIEATSYKPRKDRPQLSATVGAGFQYQPLPQIALFAEPGATYYFDNGSSADTRMKDQPLNFSMLLGVKYIIK